VIDNQPAGCAENPIQPAHLHRVKLNWNVPNIGSVSLYHVYRFRGTVVTSPTAGVVEIGSTTNTSFVDTEELPNSVEFTYFVRADFTDTTHSGASNFAKIIAINDAPAAHDFGLYAYEDTDLVGNVLTNVTDDDTSINTTTNPYAPLRAILDSVPSPLAGTLKKPNGDPLHAGDIFNGSFTFTPVVDFEGGPATFTYHTDDGLWTDGSTAMSPRSNQPSNTSSTVTITNVFSRHTTTTIASPTPSIYGNSVTFTATVAADSADSVTQFGKPAGLVTIKIDGNTVATGTPDVNGHVTFATSTLTASGTGNHTVDALYCAGDSQQYCPDHVYYGSQGSTIHHVIPRPATWTTNPASKTYGELDPVPLTTGASAASPNDFLAADGIGATYSRAAGENVGAYNIAATLTDPNGKLGNYIVTNAGAAFTINKRPATWTTNPNSKTFGGAEPVPLTTGASAASPNNFLVADGIGATYSRAVGENVGTYAITAALTDPNGKLGNYVVTNAGAIFTINQAPSTTTFGPAPTATFPGADFTVSASNNSTGSITYSYVSGPCTLQDASGGTFRPTATGSCVVQANSAATSNYLASSAQQTVNITP
jgi:hypothetical protein